MGVVTGLGWIAATFTIARAGIMGQNGVFNGCEHRLRIEGKIWGIFEIGVWHSCLLSVSMTSVIGPCKIGNLPLYAALSKRRQQSWIMGIVAGSAITGPSWCSQSALLYWTNATQDRRRQPHGQKHKRKELTPHGKRNNGRIRSPFARKLRD